LGPCAGRPNFKHLFSCFRVVKEITGLSRGFLPLIYSGNKKTFRRPNFDDELVQNLPGDRLIKAAHQVYPNARYWYLDEIQDFPNWETLINKLHRRQYNLFVTGSNANLLSTELATVLTGRHIPLELLPFSYDEFCLGTRVSRSWVSFEQYLMYGGFPEVILASTADKSSYLAALFDATILKDLVRRKRIKSRGDSLPFPRT